MVGETARPNFAAARILVCALADAGFGAEVRSALERRKGELIRQGHAWSTPEGGVRAR
jgi:hypothetical protein